MSRLNVASLRRVLVRSIIVVGIVALSVLAMRVFGPRQTYAQSAQQGEVRATSFVLVGADGSVLGRLAQGNGGYGALTLFDGAGKLRASVAGGGQVAVWDTDGHPRAQMFYDPGPGVAVINVAGAKGATNVVYNDKLDVTGAFVFDHAGPGTPPRATLGVRFDGSYGLEVRDADGNPVGAVPPTDTAP